ncbi:hypothetical protein Tco_0637544 [Tanacetum coccineum]
MTLFLIWEIIMKENLLLIICVDLNYVEEQRNNLMLKHSDLVQELNTCKEQLLVLKQAKLVFLTMQHENTKILKDNKNLRIELKELTAITETWLNSSNKVNQCISEQILSQKKRILVLDQLTEDPSSFGQTNLVFVKYLAEDIKMSILGAEQPWLSEAEGFSLPNHDIGRIFPADSLVKVIDPLVAITDSLVIEYDSTDESSVCSIPLPPLEKLAGAEPHLKSQSGSSSRSKTSRPSKLFPSCIHYRFNDHLSDDYVNYPICDIGGSYDHDIHDHNRVISLRRGIKPRNPQQVTKSCETCGSTVHTITDHNDIEWFKKGKARQAKIAEAFQSKRT